VRLHYENNRDLNRDSKTFFFFVVSTLAKKNRIANNREPIAVRACACGFHSRLAPNKQPLNGIKLLAMHHGIKKTGAI
jgi:hypothetical protein